MLKVVVFDSGYGGEFFADRLAMELPIVEIVRVIDWRNADAFLKNASEARKLAEKDLRPYIGKVDLIILANYLLTMTSLKYFRRKYRNQKFVGLSIEKPEMKHGRDTMVLTTRAVSRTISYYNFLFRLKRRVRTLVVDGWPEKIDDGVLSEKEIKTTLKNFAEKMKIRPKEVVLACAQFYDIKTELTKALGSNLKIYDSFEETLRCTCKALDIRGGTGRKEKG